MTKPGVKILLSGLSNSGKTNALRTLDPAKTLVVSVDGKTFPFAIPHFNVSSFPSIEGLLYGYTQDGVHVEGVTDKIAKFYALQGHYPDTIVFDTVSRIFHLIADNCNEQYKNFDVHSNIAKQIAELNTFIQTQLIENGVSVVQVTHVTFDDKTNTYPDASSGSYKKAGGAIGTHDHCAFFTIKNKKYRVIHRSPGLPCRTLLTESQLPSEQDADDYSLANHIKLLQDSTGEVAKFSL